MYCPLTVQIDDYHMISLLHSRLKSRRYGEKILKREKEKRKGRRMQREKTSNRKTLIKEKVI